MNIQETFEQLEKKNESALIVYTMAGFPTLERSMNWVRDLGEAGADMIEIGVPFSDPIADGPTIQFAGTEALRNGVTLKHILDSVRKIQTDKPLILMSYLNPLLAYGMHRVFQDMKHAGISGLIVPDLPIEESLEWIQIAERHAVKLIFLVTPVSGKERIRQIVSLSKGFLYCVSLAGTTGARKDLPAGLNEFLSEVRSTAVRQSASSRQGVKGRQSPTCLPIAVGFGISTPDQVGFLSGQADGVIVGSRIVEAIKNNENVTAIVRNLKRATKR